MHRTTELLLLRLPAAIVARARKQQLLIQQ
jgi:hypothetical protein